VLLMIVEDYVEPAELAAAFEQSGLAGFVYKGAGGPRWPTLRQLIESGQRVVVFVESGRSSTTIRRRASSCTPPSRRALASRTATGRRRPPAAVRSPRGRW